MPTGEAHNRAKMTVADVIELRAKWRAGETWRTIARDMKMSITAVREAGVGKTFPDVPNPCPVGVRPGWAVRLAVSTQEDRQKWGRDGRSRQPNSPAAKLTLEEVGSIRSRLKNGDRKMDIAEAFGVSRHAIWAIQSGRYWRPAPDT